MSSKHIMDRNEFQHKYHSFAHVNIKDDDGKTVCIEIVEDMNNTGPCYLMTEIDNNCITFGCIPDYTDYYKMTKYEDGVSVILNKFSNKDIFEYIDSNTDFKAEIFDSIEIFDF